MSALKRNPGTWILILILAAGFFLLREQRSSAATTLTITTARTFASLDNSVDDCNGAVGIFEPCADNLVITAPSGAITCDESGTPASACPINIHVRGDLEIQAGGSIHAENLGGNGGQGGNITLDVDGNFTMRGASGGNPAAFISSRNFSGGNSHGGQILITVGGVTLDTSVDPAVGICGTPTGDILMEPGTQINSSAAQSVAGDIALYAGRNITIQGQVLAIGLTGGGHGGAITIQACCNLLVDDTGQVISRGRDPGPDRVHLQGCAVTIYGLVASQGPAHQSPAPLCTPPTRPGKALNSTACVEIWSGTTVVIDSTGTHFGEITADTATSGGISGHGWIDILAQGDISIIDGTNDDPGLLDGFATDHAVHANQYLGNGRGGDIQVLSEAGKVSTSGNALQASDTLNGAHGGTVKVQSGGSGSPAGDVLFGTASIQAEGSTGGSLLSRGGGTISGRSFNGDLSGAAGGELNAFGGPPLGSVTLEACMFATYLGTSTPPFVLGPNDGACGSSPAFPVLAPPEAYPLATCATLCQPVTNTPTSTQTITQTSTPTNTPTNTNTPTSTQTITQTNTPTSTPTPGIICQKSEVQGALAGHVPDAIVRLDLNQSIQAAVTAASDTNGDGFVIVLVVKDGTGQLGGHTNQRVTVSRNDYGHPFQLFGCSVTMHDPDIHDGLPTGWITAGAGGANTIFTMDLHGADSDVAGWKVEGNNRTVRNTGGSGSPVGIWFNGNNNVMHNGAASGNGVGLKITGNGNIATDTDVFSNTLGGVQVIGNSNQLLKIDAGDLGKGNTGDGINVDGTGNLIQECDAFANTVNGIVATGGNNTLKKNNGGDRGKGNGQKGFVLGGSGLVRENSAEGNGSFGFDITSGGHNLVSNISGGTGSGEPNGGCQFNVAGSNANGGGNKSNGTTVVGSPFPTGCTN